MHEERVYRGQMVSRGARWDLYCLVLQQNGVLRSQTRRSVTPLWTPTNAKEFPKVMLSVIYRGYLSLSKISQTNVFVFKSSWTQWAGNFP